MMKLRAFVSTAWWHRALAFVLAVATLPADAATHTVGLDIGQASDGVSPVVGVGADFGSKRLRAGLFADLSPRVGDTNYVVCYGIGLRLLFGATRMRASSATLMRYVLTA
jgi:hypothetical protein